MTITSRKLREIFEVLIIHLEKNDLGSIEIPWDFYWNMSPEVRYNPYLEPTTFDLGQLTEDWDKLVKIGEGAMPPVGYALVWLAAILRAAGEKAAA